jgi:glycosyltransferase involved in cell wall biosynthesis
VVGYIGHFSPLKGVPDLLSAFEQLAPSRPRARLILAWSGKGADHCRVLAQIESSRVQDQIQLLGKVDVAQFMAACDVIALPFLGSSIPHFPVVLLEAFGSRTPVVTTRVGGVPEVVVDGETGLLASPGNPAELARALTQILDDQLLRQRIIVQAERAFQERFNSDAVAVRYIELYQEVIA